MKIGFDGKRTTQNHTGLGNYGRYIVRLLTKYFPKNEYSIFALRAPSQNLIVDLAEYQYPKHRFLNPYWRSVGMVKDLLKHKIDLFHGLSNEIPYGLKKAGIPSVVTIHDLIFLRYPEYYSFFDRFIYKLKFRHAVLNADKVIAISEQTSRDLVKYLGVKEERIEVVYQNCDPIFHQSISLERRAPVIKKHQLPDRYLLSVGTIEERKNLMLIVKALKKIDNVSLVVVGKETGYTKKVRKFITEHKLADRIHFLNNVLHSELPTIYQQAQIFIYPSRFEGFGIPIIEALHSGIPVIASKGSCLEEAGGPGSIYVDPDDDADLARKIIELLEDNVKKARMVDLGRQHLETFQDHRIANQMLQLYKNVIANA